MASSDDKVPPVRQVGQFQVLFKLDIAQAKTLRHAVEKLCDAHLNIKYTAMDSVNKKVFPIVVEKAMKLENVDKNSVVQRDFLIVWMRDYHSRVKRKITKPHDSSKEGTPVGPDHAREPDDDDATQTLAGTSSKRGPTTRAAAKGGLSLKEPKISPKPTTISSDSDTEKVLTLKKPKLLPRSTTSNRISKRKSSDERSSGEEDLEGSRTSKRRKVEGGSGRKSLTASVVGNAHVTQHGEQSMQVSTPAGSATSRQLDEYGPPEDRRMSPSGGPSSRWQISWREGIPVHTQRCEGCQAILKHQAEMTPGERKFVQGEMEERWNDDTIERKLRKELYEKEILIASLQEKIDHSRESLAKFRDQVRELQNELDLRRNGKSKFGTPLYVPSSPDGRREDRLGDAQL
ncbi:hypothetical protein DFP72DRAFT_1067408 [Ephemerocybe angulata]|uniref:Uncharacterized protein n=1 Tax=Ephemerocybe angulata TaxID=980116 RepID=A0A8H6I0B3_9AGAR|nr:hypothetical protein DFP72DRAFT_1067408 [Tulosesus angulatus]